MQRYMQTQIKRIELDKWLEGCKRKSDPGKMYIYNWIQNKAHWFREAWNNSLCKNCQLCEICGTELKESCDNFDLMM